MTNSQFSIFNSQLYLLPTPIAGEELPNRQVILGLRHFVVENTRTARRLLARLMPVDELHFAELNEHTRPEEVEGLLAPLLEGHDVGLMSEAGLPGVADPGAELVALCHRRGIGVVPLPGAGSLMLALMASGLCGQRFACNGYLPVKPPERLKAIRAFERRATQEGQSQLFIEAPYRNDKLLQDFLSACAPTTRLCVAADLLAPTQYIRTLSVGEWRKVERPALHKRPAVFIIN